MRFRFNYGAPLLLTTLIVALGLTQAQTSVDAQCNQEPTPTRDPTEAVVIVEVTHRAGQKPRRAVGVFVDAGGFLIVPMHVVRDREGRLPLRGGIKLRPSPRISQDIRDLLTQPDLVSVVAELPRLDLAMLAVTVNTAARFPTLTPLRHRGDGSCRTQNVWMIRPETSTATRMSSTLTASWRNAVDPLPLVGHENGRFDEVEVSPLCMARPTGHNAQGRCPPSGRNAIPAEVLTVDQGGRPGWSGSPLLSTRALDGGQEVQIVGITILRKVREQSNSGDGDAVAVEFFQRDLEELRRGRKSSQEELERAEPRSFPWMLPEVRTYAAIVAEADEFELPGRARCAISDAWVDALDTIVSDSERFATSNPRGSDVVPPSQDFRQQDSVISQQTAAIAANSACGPDASHLTRVVRALLTALALQRHFGAVRTLWAAVSDAFLAPPEESGPTLPPSDCDAGVRQWARRGTIGIANPLERLLNCRLATPGPEPGGLFDPCSHSATYVPGGPRACTRRVRDTDPCETFAVLDGAGLLSEEGRRVRQAHDTSIDAGGGCVVGGALSSVTFPTCRSPEICAEWNRVLGDVPVDRRWFTLDQATQARYRSRMFQSRLIELRSLLHFASEAVQENIRQRAVDLSDDPDLPRTLSENVQVLAPLAARYPRVDELNRQVQALQRRMRFIPQPIRDMREPHGTTAETVLRAFVSEDVLVPAMTEQGGPNGIKTAIDESATAAYEISLTARNLISDLLVPGHNPSTSIDGGTTSIDATTGEARSVTDGTR